MDANHDDARYLIDWNGYAMVERNPSKLSGTPILRGSRMPAQGIIENYMSGYSPDEVADLFELPKSGVRALVAEAVARNPELLRR